jgi:parvulin-like peptidyl-prolyl isomerase
VRKLLTPTLLTLTAALALALSACQSNTTSATAPGGGEVAATVNGTKITVDDVNRVLAEQYRGEEKNLAPIELAAARLQALDGLITNEVLYQRAQKENLQPTDEEVNRFIQRSKEESGMTEQDFEKRLKETNQTEPQFRETIRKQLAIEKLQEKISQGIKIQEREVEDFFNSNRQLFVARPGVGLSDIIVDPADNGLKFDAKGEVAAQQKINEIHTRLKNGTDFATLARGQSEDPQSAARSGDLGFVPQDQFAAFAQQGLAGLGEKLMGMSEGDITAPVKDGAGRWHIFKVTQKRTESRDLTLADPEVKTQITNAIREQRRQLVNQAYVAQARDEAKIENHLAKAVLDSPNNLGVLRPVKPASASASPGASPAASPAAAANASPSVAASPKK